MILDENTTPAGTSPLGRWTASRGFGLFDLGCGLACVALLWAVPGLGGLPLLVGLLPWGLRAASGRFPFRRTGLDGFVLVFGASAGVGAAVAFQPEQAWLTFRLILGGILLYYALAGQPAENRLWAAGFLTLVGAGVALFFLFTNDWNIYPAKIGILDRIAEGWMRIRPPAQMTGLQPNHAAGIIALTLPFLAWLGWEAWRQKRAGLWLWVGAAGLVEAAGFVLATSRGALLALGAAGLVGAIQWFSGRPAPEVQAARRRKWGFALSLTILLAGGCGLLLLVGPASLTAAGGSITRLEIYRNTLRLIQDEPLTGGGLGSFSGLYSTYMLSIPNFMFPHSHDLYLNVALEQGIFGFLSLAGIYLGSLWAALRAGLKRERSGLATAALVSLACLVLHNLVDVVTGTPQTIALIFLVPGMAQFVYRAGTPAADAVPAAARRGLTRRAVAWIAGGVILVVLAGVLFYRPLLAAWQAERGAVQMDRVFLADFPSDHWNEGQHLDELGLAEANFRQALQSDPANRTANFRLGRIALLRQDFAAARPYLEAAYLADPQHRGVIKDLGYVYVWEDRLEQALPLLAQIPEVPQELDVYAWWWGTQNRPDLSERAGQALQRLK